MEIIVSQEKIENDGIEKDTLPLPPEVIYNIFSQISNIPSKKETPRSSFALACKQFGLNPFQSDRMLAALQKYLAIGKWESFESLINIKPDLTTQALKIKLFALASYAKQTEIRNILQEYPEWVTIYRPLDDISGHFFNKITIFQHARWSGDIYYMCNMILDCLPINDLGEKLRIELLRQFHEINKKIEVYDPQGEKQRVAQFDLQILLDAYTLYTEEYDHYDDSDKSKQWVNLVGKAQNLLPAFIRQLICNSLHVRSTSVPQRPNWLSLMEEYDFRQEEFIRTLEVFRYDDDRRNNQPNRRLWDKTLEGVGEKYAINSGYNGAWLGGDTDLNLFHAPHGGVRGCRAELEHLKKVRAFIEEDLVNLEKRLNTPLQEYESRYSVNIESHNIITWPNTNR